MGLCAARAAPEAEAEAEAEAEKVAALEVEAEAEKEAAPEKVARRPRQSPPIEAVPDVVLAQVLRFLPLPEAVRASTSCSFFLSASCAPAFCRDFVLKFEDDDDDDDDDSRSKSILAGPPDWSSAAAFLSRRSVDTLSIWPRKALASPSQGRCTRARLQCRVQSRSRPVDCCERFPSESGQGGLGIRACQVVRFEFHHEWGPLSRRRRISQRPPISEASASTTSPRHTTLSSTAFVAWGA